MLDPKGHIVFLPQDREIMDITGMSEEEYRWFVKQAVFHSKLRPGEPTNFLVIPFLIKLAIGVALSFAASLLTRRDAQEQRPQQERQIGGQSFVNSQRFAPTSGFDSVQNVVELGSTIPLVYANRRQVGSKVYGGVRVNTNLLWCQLYSIGGGQLLRSIFLIGEGTIPEPDITQFAIGNNLIRNFDIELTDVSRLSIYYADGSRESNRLVSSDYIAGRDPALDLGNLQTQGAADVFQTRTDTSFAPDFCSVITPSNQTDFGVSGFVGNNMPYRISPRIRPADNIKGSDPREDATAKTEREKDVWKYFGRAAVISYNGAPGVNEVQQLNVGDRITYAIFSQSDNDGSFQFQVSGPDGFTSTDSVASSVASRQNQYDDQIIVGDRYLLGTAKGICVDRTKEAFNSEINGINSDPEIPGTSIEAVFEVTEPGEIHVYDGVPDGDGFSTVNPPLEDEYADAVPRGFTSDGRWQNRRYPQYADNVFDTSDAPVRVNATRTSHIQRLTEASFTTERKTRFIEVGLRSTINLSINNLCFFRGVTKNGDDVYRFDDIDADKNGENITYTNDVISDTETRYSCFKVGYRSSGAQVDYTPIDTIFAVRSRTTSQVFNYLRFEFADANIYEFLFTPVSGYELRQSTLPIQVLDYRPENRESVTFGDVTVVFSGVANFSRTKENFSLSLLTTKDGNAIGDTGAVGLRFDDSFDGTNYFSDAYARVAEFFMHEELQATTSSAEHSIAYVDVQTENSITPDYANLALVGLNIRSSREINQLQQFSVYCEQGIEFQNPRTNSVGPTNRFPDVLYDLLTNRRYGTGTILNPEQIDFQSFEDAADFCESRLYFFDGVIEEKLNIRSWAAQTSQAFLLDFVIRNGKFALQPAVKLDGTAEEITGLYTAGNIIEDSFELSYVDEQERIPPRVQVRWRDEKADRDKGNFPIIRQVTVRENTTPQDAPLEQIDASAFATSQEHAIDVGKFICRSRRLVTHSVSFSTTPPESSLDIGSVFKLGLETVNYDQPQNGAITSTGEVTAWPPLNDGTYDVLLWDGTNLQETNISVFEGKSAPAGSVFCLRNTTSRAGTYKTQSLSFNEEGNIQVEATFFPTNDQGISLIAEGFDDPDKWEIEGEI